MITFLRMTTLAVVALTMFGCAELQEYQREVASRPVYQNVYRPALGLTQQYPLNTSYTLCSAEADTVKQQTYNAAIANSQRNSGSSNNGHLGSTLAASLAAGRAQTTADNSYWIQLNACMVKSGYSMQKVCVKNCYTTQPNKYSPQTSQRSRDRGEPWKRIYCKDQSIPPIITAHEAQYCPKGSSPY